MHHTESATLMLSLQKFPRTPVSSGLRYVLLLRQSTEGTQRAHDRQLNLEVLGPLVLLVAWSEGSRLKGLILRHTGSTDSLDHWFGDSARPANDSTLDRCSVKRCKWCGYKQTQRSYGEASRVMCIPKIWYSHGV